MNWDPAHVAGQVSVMTAALCGVFSLECIFKQNAPCIVPAWERRLVAMPLAGLSAGLFLCKCDRKILHSWTLVGGPLVLSTLSDPVLSMMSMHGGISMDEARLLPSLQRAVDTL
jgi:hypothetical protein